MRAALDIVQVVGEGVALRKAGRSLVGLCPFHQEKTPSFHVDPAKGVYYCFGCGAGGDAFRFVMQLHGVEFPEAVAMIGERLGMPRPAPSGGDPVQARQDDRNRRRALEALAEAQSFFGAALAGRVAGVDAAAARAYLGRRGFAPEAAPEYGIGYAPGGWDGLLRHLVARGFRVEDAVRAGLAVPRPSGEGAYDRFRHRLTFPIRDAAGRLVSFGGRALGDDDPKYLNGPETEVYDKSRTLFRLHESSRDVRETGRAVIVEGYFDALGLAAAGVKGVVAVCGTAFGAAHARLLRRYAEQVVLLFDGDAAGRRAVHRALGPLLAGGFTVRIAALPDGKDPDDVAREGGSAAVEALLASAGDLAHYLVREARREFDVTSLEGRVKALEMILGHVVHLESGLARAEAASRAAEGLGIDDVLVRDELRRAARERRRELAASAARPQRSAPRLSAAEEVLLRYLTTAGRDEPEAAEALAAEIPLEALGATARAAVEAWLAARMDGRRPDLQELAGVLDEGGAAILRAAFGPGEDPSQAAARAAVDALRRPARAARAGHLAKLMGQTPADSPEYQRLIAEWNELRSEIRMAQMTES